MQNTLSREIKKARMSIWWKRNDGYIYVVLFCIFSAVAGAFTMSLVDKGERLDLMHAHADDIARLRKLCRDVVDERDDQVRQSADAAAGAATAASTAAEALAILIEAKPMPSNKPAVPAKPAPIPNIGAAVREANRRMESAP